MVSKEKFIEFWNTAESLEDVAEAAGVCPDSAKVRACRYRKQGIEMRFFLSLSPEQQHRYDEIDWNRSSASVARKLGISRQAVHQYRRRKNL